MLHLQLFPCLRKQAFVFIILTRTLPRLWQLSMPLSCVCFGSEVDCYRVPLPCNSGVSQTGDKDSFHSLPTITELCFTLFASSEYLLISHWFIQWSGPRLSSLHPFETPAGRQAVSEIRSCLTHIAHTHAPLSIGVKLCSVSVLIKMRI